MNNIIQNLENGNWSEIKKSIKANKINFDYLVDQTNGLLHYLVYHNKINLIKLIDSNLLREIIDQPNIEGDTICHIAAKLKNKDIFDLRVNINPKIIYTKNRLSYTPLFYLVSNSKIIKDIVSSIAVEDHYLNNEYTLLEYYILTGNLKMVKFILENIKINNFTNGAIHTIITLDLVINGEADRSPSRTMSDNIINFKLKLMQILINHNIDVNHLNSQLLSPLIISIQNNLYDITKFLIKNGALELLVSSNKD